MSSPSAENLRRCIEGNSSAIWFGVVHLGSRKMGFEGGPAGRWASSLVSAENISLAVAAASAGHRKGIKGTMAHRRCNRHGRTVGLSERIVNAVDHRSSPPFGESAPSPAHAKARKGAGQRSLERKNHPRGGAGEGAPSRHYPSSSQVRRAARRAM